MNTPVIQPAPDPARIWNILCHLSALIGFVFPLGFVFGPLIVWLLKRNEFPSVDVNGKEALNFQLSFLIYAIISAILTAVFIGFLLLLVVGVTDLILVIIASVRASNGENYRYPFTIRFFK